jgi:hypothetical protein
MSAPVAFDANRFDPAAVAQPEERHLPELAGFLSHEARKIPKEKPRDARAGLRSIRKAQNLTTSC